MVSRSRSLLTAVAAFVALVVLWELAKLLLPADGVSVGGTRLLPRTGDDAMPHVWTVLGRLGTPEVAGAASRTVGVAVASGVLFTLGLALGGLVIGGCSGCCSRWSWRGSGWCSARPCPTSWRRRRCR